jgi:hypothetical protein
MLSGNGGQMAFSVDRGPANAQHRTTRMSYLDGRSLHLIYFMRYATCYLFPVEYGKCNGPHSQILSHSERCGNRPTSGCAHRCRHSFSSGTCGPRTAVVIERTGQYIPSSLLCVSSKASRLCALLQVDRVAHRSLMFAGRPSSHTQATLVASTAVSMCTCTQ